MANEQRPTPETTNVPDAEGRDRDLRKNRRPVPGAGEEQRGIDSDIAAADKRVRTGASEEAVRDTAPFGDFVEPPFASPGDETRDEKRSERERRDRERH